MTTGCVGNHHTTETNETRTQSSFRPKENTRSTRSLKADVKNSSYTATVVTLVVMIGVASWQFYSLTWGGVRTGSYVADRSTKSWPSEMARPTLAAAPR